MRLLSSHYTASPNVGDAVSSPFLYFDLGEHEVVPFSELIPRCDAVVFGGGALGHSLARMSIPARVKIAWGVGVSLHGKTEPGPAPEGFTLYGSREWQQPGAEYAPCASCMSPLFDQDYPILHDAVFYWNRRKQRPNVSGLPERYNEIAFAEAVAFLGSGETVVTNSYHGAYWATLLGRKVVVVETYSSKFHSFKHQPVISNDWLSADPLAYPEALGDARTVTVAFHARVMDALAG